MPTLALGSPPRAANGTKSTASRRWSPRHAQRTRVGIERFGAGHGGSARVPTEHRVRAVQAEATARNLAPFSRGDTGPDYDTFRRDYDRECKKNTIRNVKLQRLNANYERLCSTITKDYAKLHLCRARRHLLQPRNRIRNIPRTSAKSGRINMHRQANDARWKAVGAQPRTPLRLHPRPTAPAEPSLSLSG